MRAGRWLHELAPATSLTLNATGASSKGRPREFNRRRMAFPGSSLLGIGQGAEQRAAGVPSTALEDEFLPFSFSDLSCVGMRKGGATPPEEPQSRPLEGLQIHVPDIVGLSKETATIKRLGGRIAALDMATHCVVRSSLQVIDIKYNATIRRAMRHCQSKGICVVEQSWLTAVAALPADKDAFSVDVDPHIPAVMAILDDEEMADEIKQDKQALERATRIAKHSSKTADAANDVDIASSASSAAEGVTTTRRAADLPAINKSLSETMSFLKRTNPKQVRASAYSATTLFPLTLRPTPCAGGGRSVPEGHRALATGLCDPAAPCRTRGAPPDRRPVCAFTHPSSICISPWGLTWYVWARRARYTVLQVAQGASMSAVRAAYRRRALETHPDRGGHPGTFLQVQHAYQRLVEQAEKEAAASAPPGAPGGKEASVAASKGGSAPSAAKGDVHGGGIVAAIDVSEDGIAAAKRGDTTQTDGPRLLTGPKVDEALADHRALVDAWFDRVGVDRNAGVDALAEATDAMGLETVDVGASNTNEKGERMYNQCFYLSLARSFLREDGGGGEPAKRVIGETALHFKRVVEAAVLRTHPEWADSQVGENLQGAHLTTSHHIHPYLRMPTHI